MGTLTKNERDGLEEVFLSIQPRGEKNYKKIKELSSFFITKISLLTFSLIHKNSTNEPKWASFSHFFSDLSKKKKNLSK